MKRSRPAEVRPVPPALDRAQASYRRRVDARRQWLRCLVAATLGVLAGLGIAIATLGLPA